MSGEVFEVDLRAEEGCAGDILNVTVQGSGGGSLCRCCKRT